MFPERLAKGYRSFIGGRFASERARYQELAGLVCYQKESFNYVFGITKMDKDFYVVLERTARGKSAVIASQKISLDGPVQLQVKAVGDKYQFAYALNQGDFVNLGGTVSGDILSTDVAGGFTGSLVGLYATTTNDVVANVFYCGM